MGNIRSDLKHYFIKQIMLRFDFEGLLESDIEKCIIAIRNELFQAGYINYNKRQENKIDFQLRTDLNIQEENPFSINNFNQSEVHSFISDKNEIIEINMRFVTLTVDIDKNYETFDNYIDLMTRVITECAKTSPYYKMVRFGLRKINVVFFNKLEDISHFFKASVINCDDVIKDFNDYQYKASTFVNLFEQNSYKINYVRNIQEGVMQKEHGGADITYQMVVDTDVFNDDILSMADIFKSKQTVKSMIVEANTLSFNIYIKSLQPSFIEVLKEETFSDTRITGVI